MKKKIILTLTLAVMLVCILAISVSAHDVTRKVTLDNGTEVALYDDGGYALTYYLDDSGNLVSQRTVDVITVDGNGTAKYNSIANMSVVVANFQGAEVEALDVKQVPSYYYGSNGGSYHSYNDTIEYVYLPDTLTGTVTNQFRCTSKLKIVDVTRNSKWETMGQYSFYYATGLKEFYYPPKVKTTPGSGNDGVRGTAATFSHCTSLKNLYFYDNSEIETFGSACFNTCTSLETVKLPNTITHLPDWVFAYCSSLTQVNLPNSIKTIANHAFFSCKALEVIRMGNSFEYFNNTGDNSFTYYCNSVKEIYIPKSFYATAPDTSLQYKVSYAFAGVTADCKFFYCGTVDEFATAKANFSTQVSATSYNNKFLNATVITYAEYLADTEAYATGNYVICGYNACDAFYESVHVEDNNPCVINCDRCGANCVAEANPVHSVSITITYVTFDKVGTKTVACTNEGCTHGSTEEAPVLFTCLGYSAPENGTGGIAIGFSVDNEAIEEYEAITGTTVKYGVFAILKDRLGDKNIFAEDGALAEGAIAAEISNHQFALFELKIVGFEEQHKAIEIAMGAFVAVDNGETTEYSYMQGGTPNEGEKYYFVSYNDIVKPSTDTDTPATDTGVTE